MRIREIVCECGKDHRLNESVVKFACSCGAIIDLELIPVVEVEVKEPRIVRIIKRFAADSDKGIGDTVERIITAIGGRTLTRLKSQLDALGINCGCEDRRDWLNASYPYES